MTDSGRERGSVALPAAGKKDQHHDHGDKDHKHDEKEHDHGDEDHKHDEKDHDHGDKETKNMMKKIMTISTEITTRTKNMITNMTMTTKVTIIKANNK